MASADDVSGVLKVENNIPLTAQTAKMAERIFFFFIIHCLLGYLLEYQEKRLCDTFN